MNFNPNDKIVCVDDALPYDAFEYPGGYVKQGQVYCVAGIGPKGGVLVSGYPALFWGFDFGWCGFRFRKINKTRNQIRSTEDMVNTIFRVINDAPPFNEFLESRPDLKKLLEEVKIDIDL